MKIFRNDVSIKSVLVGYCVHFFGGLLIALIFSYIFWFSMIRTEPDMSFINSFNIMHDGFNRHGIFSVIFNTSISYLSALFGGYVAGRLCGKSAWFHGMLVGVLILIEALIYWYLEGMKNWSLMTISLWVSIFPFAVLGGWLSGRTKRLETP